MLYITLGVLVISGLYITDISALSCPCYKYPELFTPVQFCDGSQVAPDDCEVIWQSPCHCCLTCARRETEECGMIYNMKYECGEGLVCSYERTPLPVDEESQKPGTCIHSKTENYQIPPLSGNANAGWQRPTDVYQWRGFGKNVREHKSSDHTTAQTPSKEQQEWNKEQQEWSEEQQESSEEQQESSKEQTKPSEEELKLSKEQTRPSEEQPKPSEERPKLNTRKLKANTEKPQQDGLRTTPDKLKQLAGSLPILSNNQDDLSIVPPGSAESFTRRPFGEFVIGHDGKIHQGPVEVWDTLPSPKKLNRIPNLKTPRLEKQIRLFDDEVKPKPKRIHNKGGRFSLKHALKMRGLKRPSRS